MGELVELVRAGRDAHAAARQVARREGDPGGDDVRRAEPPIRRILVPGDVARVVGVLDDEGRLTDRKSVVEGKSVSVRVDMGCGRIIKQKNQNNMNILDRYD